ncbi:hypothetical protein ACFLRF_02620 [Candidatus Altiarchaeota archaeon]
MMVVKKGSGERGPEDMILPTHAADMLGKLSQPMTMTGGALATPSSKAIALTDFTHSMLLMIDRSKLETARAAEGGQQLPDDQVKRYTAGRRMLETLKQEIQGGKIDDAAITNDQDVVRIRQLALDAKQQLGADKPMPAQITMQKQRAVDKTVGLYTTMKDMLMPKNV